MEQLTEVVKYCTEDRMEVGSGCPARQQQGRTSRRRSRAQPTMSQFFWSEVIHSTWWLPAGQLVAEDKLALEGNQ